MKLTPNFSLKELTESYTATRLGIDNTPSTEIIARLNDLCIHILEPVRAHFGKPVKINSGYRCLTLNKAVGGVKSSDHLFGFAADISISGVSNFDLGKWIEENLEFKQLIYEFCKKDDAKAGWIHISYCKGKNNKSVVHIK